TRFTLGEIEQGANLFAGGVVVVDAHRVLETHAVRSIVVLELAPELIGDVHRFVRAARVAAFAVAGRRLLVEWNRLHAILDVERPPLALCFRERVLFARAREGSRASLIASLDRGP